MPSRLHARFLIAALFGACVFLPFVGHAQAPVKPAPVTTPVATLDTVSTPTLAPHDITPKIIAPSEVKAGGFFMVIGDVPKGCEYRWRNDLPLGVVFSELFDGQGRKVLVPTVAPVPRGHYRFRLETQLASPGLDPTAYAEWTVAVDGGLPVEPPNTPSTPTDPVSPEEPGPTPVVVPVEPDEPGPTPVTPADPSKVTQVTYVYEKDRDGEPSSGVMSALDKLNRQGILATKFEDDTTDGDDDVPAQYAVALKAAREKGEQAALVVQRGANVKPVVWHDVRTEADVLEAVK